MPSPIVRSAAAGLLALLAGACGSATTPEVPGVDPMVTAVTALDGAVWGVPNLDDDDEDGAVDLGRPDDADRATFGWDEAAWASLTGGRTLEVAFGEPVEGVTFWLDGAPLDDLSEPLVFDADDDPAALSVEFADFALSAPMTVTVREADGAVVVRRPVAARSAPLVLHHHLQAALELAAVELSAAGWGSNEPMLDDMEAVVGDALLSPSARDYRYDVWVQDEMEFGSASAPGHDLTVFVDSIRTGSDRNLDAFAEDHYFGPDVAVATWGEGRASSQDSFGNLEVSPPVSVDGVDYPFGRIYYGAGSERQQVTADLRDFLDRQAVQAPFTLDIGWLCVGHVDEFVTTLPDATAPRGFRVFVTDTALGLELIDGLSASASIPQYRDHGYRTVGDLQSDTSMRAYNEELQLDGIEPNIEALVAELGLSDEELVRVPGLFERSLDCGGAALALIPATVNLAAFTGPDGETTHAFLPDPFFREAGASPSEDPVVKAFDALLPPEVERHWVDDWDIYHMGWGEVHCGTNVMRDPPDNALDALDLLVDLERL